MSLTLNKMFSPDENRYALTLHAGKSGLSNTLSWVYLMEDSENAGFLRGNELIITTGIRIQSSAELLLFIEMLVRRQASGLILNTGRYLFPEQLTGEILRYCDEKNFPLFTMPWEMHIADVMQEFCLKLTRRMQQDNLLAMAFENALRTPQYRDTWLPALLSEGYPENGDYRVMVCRFSKKASLLFSAVSSFPDVYLFPYQELYVLILREETALCPQPLLSGLQKRLAADVCLGAGGRVGSLSGLQDSFSQALFSLSVASGTKQPCTVFDDLGVFRLLYQIPDRAFLQQFADESLGPLLQYDREHHSDYLKTLYLYLLHDCSIKETAAVLVTHRNTVNYRIRKIRELLHLDPGLQENRFRLLLALQIRRYLGFLDSSVESRT